MPTSEVVEPASPTHLPILSIPGWGMDWPTYQRACRYLGLNPTPELHEKLARYLLGTVATQPALRGFTRWLAELVPGRFSLGFLDLWTRLLMPSHPWRFRLNAIVALHECDPDSFRTMMSFPASRTGAWLSFVHTGIAASTNLVLGGIWLAAHGCFYAFAALSLRREQAHFREKTVLVTGASRGLGLALSARLLSLGAEVIAVSRESPALDRLKLQVQDAGLGNRLKIATADIAAPGALTHALAASKLDPTNIDIGIINAGTKETSTAACNAQALKRVFDVNVFGAMETAETLLPTFLKRGYGKLIFVSSQGRWHGMPASGSYNASKAALSILVESLAMDLGDEGRKAIGITSVEPGLIRTGMIVEGSVQDRLAVDVQKAAALILRCAAANRRICRFPRVFTLMTAALAVLPQGLRIRILGRLRQ